MEDFNEPRFEFEESTGRDGPYRPRKYRTAKRAGKKKRRIFPLALLLVVIVGVGGFWFFDGFDQIGLPGWLKGSFAPDEEIFKIRLPEALFADKNIEEVTAWAIEEQGVEDIAQSVDNTLTYTMTAEVRDRLLEIAENNLEEKIAAIKDARQYPYLVDISYDGVYKDFYLVVIQDQEQDDQTLVAASELFMLAVYYQHISAAADPVREVSITIEDTESGGVLKQLVYPEDLNRVAAVLEHAAGLEKTKTTPQVGGKVIVSTGTDNLNLRNGPEITYLIIDILSSGTVLEVTGTEGIWLEVITPDGLAGWVHGDFVEIYLDDD